MKVVSKGTCPDRVFDRNGTATYNDETVWIPSETEMGLNSYSSLIKSNSTTSNSECTKGYNAGYGYYTSDSTRVKYQMNADGTLTTSAVWHWERSRNCNGSTSVCFVSKNGSANGYAYDDANSLAPAFVIGNGTPSAKITQDGEDITDKVAEVLSAAKIATGSYTGTGTYGSSNKNTLTFDFIPMILIITANYTNNHYTNSGYIVCSSGGHSSQNGNIESAVSGNTVSWYSGSSSQIQLNSSGLVYNYVAIG